MKLSKTMKKLKLPWHLYWENSPVIADNTDTIILDVESLEIAKFIIETCNKRFENETTEGI